MPLNTTMSVLVVDDQKMMAELIASITRKLGFGDVDQAMDGETALTMMKTKRYGLVISDLAMQPMSGLQLLRAIRGDDQLKATRFLMTTAATGTEYVPAAKRAGAEGYLMKPFSPEALRAKIEMIFSGGGSST